MLPLLLKIAMQKLKFLHGRTAVIAPAFLSLGVALNKNNKRIGLYFTCVESDVDECFVLNGFSYMKEYAVEKYCVYKKAGN